MKKLKLEINARNVRDKEAEERMLASGIMITPAIDEDYWILRVKLFEDQYINAFHKFSTIGIGFAIEDDWNTNLPYTCDAEKIWNHIKHNRRYIAIKKKRTCRAIRMIQDYIIEQVGEE
jgi:hypothetical protein